MVPGDAQVSDSMTPRTTCKVSATVDPTQAANAPSGTARADDVPTAHRVSHPVDAAAARPSRTMRLFPTPAAPLTTIPDASEPQSAPLISRNSSEPPVHGHQRCTYPP